MTRRLIVAVGTVLVLTTACTGGSKPAATPTASPMGSTAGPTGSPTPTAGPAASAPGPYRPAIDPAKFTDRVTNRYFPLTPGTRLVYDGVKDGEPWHDEVVVTADTRMVMGVRCVVVKDTVTVKGELEEQTADWYAQDDAGNVWYFGEMTAEYSGGKVTNTKGSWEAGVNGAQPGIIMEAAPRVGDIYRQEFYAGEAEDVARVLGLDATVQTPAGSYTAVLVTEDTNPFTPGEVEHKFYAPGVGFVSSSLVKGGKEEVKLTRIVKG